MEPTKMEKKNKNMFLYWGSGSPPCMKAIIALEEKGLWDDLPNKLIEFSKKEHKQDEVLALNPRGQMPTFKDGDIVVNESSAICEYLEEAYKDQGTKLMPDNLKDKAMVLQRMHETSNIQSLIIEPLLMYIFRTKEEDLDMKLIEENTVKAKEELDRWNKILGDKQFVCGNDFTMADVFLFPLIALRVKYGATLSDYSDLKGYHDRVSNRPSVQTAWPPHWKGTEGKTLLKLTGI